jgi:hypothetical protein
MAAPLLLCGALLELALAAWASELQASITNVHALPCLSNCGAPLANRHMHACWSRVAAQRGL